MRMDEENNETVEVVDKRRNFMGDIPPASNVKINGLFGPDYQPCELTKPEVNGDNYQDIKERFPWVPEAEPEVPAVSDDVVDDQGAADAKKRPFVLFMFGCRKGKVGYRIVTVREESITVLQDKARKLAYKHFPTKKGYSGQDFVIYELSTRFVKMCWEDMQARVKEWEDSRTRIVEPKIGEALI